MKCESSRAGVAAAKQCCSGRQFWMAVFLSIAPCVWLSSDAAAGPRPTAMAAGDVHSCVLTSSGAIQCWGANASGQLGDGSTVQRLTPVAVTGLTSGAEGIAAGGGDGPAHTCAITSGGGVVCWGSNATGQLGNNSTTD